jgi:DNA-binding transcriptional ArsR family regulator
MSESPPKRVICSLLGLRGRPSTLAKTSDYARPDSEIGRILRLASEICRNLRTSEDESALSCAGIQPQTGPRCQGEPEAPTRAVQQVRITVNGQRLVLGPISRRWPRSTQSGPSEPLRKWSPACTVTLVVAQRIAARRLSQPPPRGWTFITNHAQVLLAVAQKPDLRVREIASATAITERYAYSVLRDLEDAGYVERRRDGRCNLYRIHPELALGDPMVEEHSLSELLRLTDESDGDEVVAMSASARLRNGRPRPSRLRPLQRRS